MDHGRFKENYTDLVQLSDRGADIYGSVLCREIIERASLDPAVDALSVALKMQLEQEKFFRSDGILGLTDLPQKRRAVSHQDICDNLRERLAMYRQEERRGALLNMQERIAAENGYTWTERDRLISARMPEEQLRSQVALGIERLAKKICIDTLAHMDLNLGEGDGAQDLEFPSSPAAAAAAISVAAYAEFPDLQDRPEQIASASASVAIMMAAYIEDHSEQIETFAEVMLGFAEILLCGVIVLASLAMTVTFIVEMAEVGIGAALIESIKAFLALFIECSAHLKVATGLSAAGLLAKAALYLARTDEAPLSISETGLQTAMPEEPDESLLEEEIYEEEIRAEQEEGAEVEETEMLPEREPGR